MTDRLRIVLAARGAKEFLLLHALCEQNGHVPVAYAYSRSAKPRGAAFDQIGRTLEDILAVIPPGIDLLLPASARGLVPALSGYEPDLLMVCGFGWRITQPVLDVPRLGAVNIHPSALPRHRGPQPILWAIRNGESDFGVSVHRMDANFDTGDILAQRTGIPLDDDPTPERIWLRLEPAIRELVPVALDRIVDGFTGFPQEETLASHEGPLEPEFGYVDWSHSARDIHNQVRTFRAMKHGAGPVAEIGEQWVKVLRTRLEPSEGMRVECKDGPMWVVEWISCGLSNG